MASSTVQVVVLMLSKLTACMSCCQISNSCAVPITFSSRSSTLADVKASMHLSFSAKELLCSGSSTSFRLCCKGNAAQRLFSQIQVSTCCNTLYHTCCAAFLGRERELCLAAERLLGGDRALYTNSSSWMFVASRSKFQL